MLRFGRLRVGLVVDGDVEVHVLRVLTEHPAQTALDDVGDLEGECRIVGHHRRVGRRQQQGVAVGVLESLAGQCGAPGGRTQHEAAGHLVGRGPEAVAGALESEHRIEDVDRDHWFVVRRIRRPDGGERCGRARLVDALVQDLALLALGVGEHQLGVHRCVELAVAVIDLQARKPRVHPEGAGLVGDDRHDARSDVAVAQQLFEYPDRRHSGSHVLVSRPGLERLIDLAGRKRQRLGLGAALRQESAEGGAPVQQIANLRRLRARMIVGREVRVLLELGVAEWDLHRVTEIFKVLQCKLFHLVGCVAALKVRTQGVTLDRLGEDHRGLPLVFHRSPVGPVDLPVVVAAALEVPDLAIADVGHQRLGPRVTAEEVLPNVGSVVGLVGLEVAVGRGVHQIDQGAVGIGLQQGVPLAAPHHLDHVPAGTPKEGFQFLNDLAVAAHRSIEALQVAVHHEGQVVQALQCGDVG